MRPIPGAALRNTGEFQICEIDARLDSREMPNSVSQNTTSPGGFVVLDPPVVAIMETRVVQHGGLRDVRASRVALRALGRLADGHCAGSSQSERIECCSDPLTLQRSRTWVE